MSDAELALATLCKYAGLPAPVREYQFAAPQRKWRFDLAWPDRMIAVEVDGGSWIGGRHTSGSGFEKDMEKSNHAQLLGWTVLRFTPRMVEEGTALEFIEEAFGLARAAR